MSESHGWAFVSANRVVHSGPVNLVRIVFTSNTNGDNLKAYDGSGVEGRQICELRGDTDYTEGYEFGAELANGLYVTLSGNCFATVVFDPLGDE